MNAAILLAALVVGGSTGSTGSTDSLEDEARAALALANARAPAPVPKSELAIKGEAALKLQRPLIVFIGVPARPIDGALTCRCDDFAPGVQQGIAVNVPDNGFMSWVTSEQRWILPIESSTMDLQRAAGLLGKNSGTRQYSQTNGGRRDMPSAATRLDIAPAVFQSARQC